MDYVLVSDLARYFVVVLALLLIAMYLRIMFLKWRKGTLLVDPPHPATICGTMALLGVAIFRRFERLGLPGDWVLWVVLAALLGMLYGVYKNYSLTFTPPWRRH